MWINRYASVISICAILPPHPCLSSPAVIANSSDAGKEAWQRWRARWRGVIGRVWRTDCVRTPRLRAPCPAPGRGNRRDAATARRRTGGRAAGRAALAPPAPPQGRDAPHRPCRGGSRPSGGVLLLAPAGQRGGARQLQPHLAAGEPEAASPQPFSRRFTTAKVGDWEIKGRL